MKQYVIYGNRIVSVKVWVESEKSPDDFDTLEAFYNDSTYLDSKTTEGEFEDFHSVEEL